MVTDISPGQFGFDPDDNVPGVRIEAGFSMIMENNDGPGGGPRLHLHPYREVFVILSGEARFTIGDREVVGSGGQILVAPANTLHKFVVTGADGYRAVHIHEGPEFETTWLE